MHSPFLQFCNSLKNSNSSSFVSIIPWTNRVWPTSLLCHLLNAYYFKCYTFFRAVCFPMTERQPFYKYIIASLFLATSLEFSRFFEFQLKSHHEKDNLIYYYGTTCMAENPYYVQYNSYWNEIFASGLVPLILLCHMNLKIFQKIKVS